MIENSIRYQKPLEHTKPAESRHKKKKNSHRIKGVTRGPAGIIRQGPKLPSQQLYISRATKPSIQIKGCLQQPPRVRTTERMLIIFFPNMLTGTRGLAAAANPR